jgi:hypothetical protein
MRSLIIQYPDSTEFTIAYPVPRADLILFDTLSQRLRQAWIEAKFNTGRLVDTHWWLFQEVAKLIPCRPTLFDVERLKGDALSLQQLFLVRAGDDGEILDSDGQLNLPDLVKLHLFEPRPQPPKDPEAPIDPPFPTSGDADCDILANLMGPFGVEGALVIYRTFDQKTIEDILYTWNELQKPLDDRRQEFVARAFLKEMENPEYQKSFKENWDF